MFDRRQRKIIDEPAVLEKFGVGPASIPDWLALVGDSADGIPGIPRWGAKASSTLLRRYGRIEKIPRHAMDWDVVVRGKAALAQSLHDHRKELELYRDSRDSSNRRPSGGRPRRSRVARRATERDGNTVRRNRGHSVAESDFQVGRLNYFFALPRSLKR